MESGRVREELASIVSNVPDPKLIISDLDPQIENQEFRIRILLSTSDGEKKVFNFG